MGSNVIAKQPMIDVDFVIAESWIQRKSKKGDHINCLGDKGHHLAFNNCEHFANVYTLGRFRSN